MVFLDISDGVRGGEEMVMIFGNILGRRVN